MLKKVSSGVLVREQSSTYPTMGKEPVSAGSGMGGWNGYASGADFTSTSLNDLFEHSTHLDSEST